MTGAKSIGQHKVCGGFVRVEPDTSVLTAYTCDRCPNVWYSLRAALEDCDPVSMKLVWRMDEFGHTKYASMVPADVAEQYEKF